jgi:hypothetical protein
LTKRATKKRPYTGPTLGQAYMFLNEAIEVLERAVVKQERSRTRGATVVSGLLLHTFLRYTQHNYLEAPATFDKFIRLFVRTSLKKHRRDLVAPRGTPVH